MPHGKTVQHEPRLHSAPSLPFARGLTLGALD
jgi:hypothetical protein